MLFAVPQTFAYRRRRRSSIWVPWGGALQDGCIAAVLAGDFPDEGQAQAGAVHGTASGFVPPEKRLEYLIPILLGDAHSGIGNEDLRKGILGLDFHRDLFLGAVVFDGILKLVDDIKNGKLISDSVIPEETMDDEVLALYDEYNNIFAEHQELWNKVFENAQKDNPIQEEACTYAEFLMLQVENCKDLFTQEELHTLKKDLERIDEIDKAIQALEETE